MISCVWQCPLVEVGKEMVRSSGGRLFQRRGAVMNMAEVMDMARV